MKRTTTTAIVLALLAGCQAPTPSPSPEGVSVPPRPSAPVQSAEDDGSAADVNAGANSDDDNDVTQTDATPIVESSRPVVLRTPELRRDAVPELCNELGGLLGSVSVDGCIAAELVHSDARSHDGRALAWVEFPARSLCAPRVLVIGGIHGDEYSSISMVFRWIERLDSEHNGTRAWRLIPSANPDGLLGVKPAQRMNARGVDLNRNFATHSWEIEAENWWVEETRSDPRRQPGTAPASEPETRWLQTFIADWKPDVIVAIHAPHTLIDFDAGTRTSLAAPQRLGFLQLQPLGTYPGSLGRYGSMMLGVPVLTLELPSAGIMPTPKDQASLWRDLSSWLDLYLPPAVETSFLTRP